MTVPPPFDGIELFDEAGYLRLHPGVAAAILSGGEETAWNHYLKHGRAEGRAPNDVDPAFYLAAYPDIAADLGRAATLADAAPHYLTLGRARGYLPNAAAPRLMNGAAFSSPSGGFWTDQANAADQIQARRALGRITAGDADKLRHFAQYGIVALETAFDKDLIQNAGLAVSQAFTGQFPELLFSRGGPDEARVPWSPELTAEPVVALDPHMISGKIRALVFDPGVTGFLTAIFDAMPKLTASQASLRHVASADRDVAWHAHSLPLQCVAVTFNLEDAAEGLEIAWPGSHRLPDLTWDGAHISLADARRTGAGQLDAAIARRETRVHGILRGREPTAYAVPAGAVMVRHVNLIHAIQAPEPPRQRRVLTAWYCPSHVSPGYMETLYARVRAMDGFTFSSGVYPAMEPSC